MEIFHQMIEAIGKTVPAWIPLICVPAMLALVAIVLTLFGGRKLYLYFVAVLGGVGFFLIACIDFAYGLSSSFIFLGLYLVLAALLRLLFLIPCPLANRKKEAKAREEKIYRKFHESLTEQAAVLGQRALPPPAEYRPYATAEAYGAHLTHAQTLLGQLKRMELTPTDRLEVDALSRSVDALSGKPLSEEEQNVLNDCLAAVLKLTAKYKL